MTTLSRTALKPRRIDKINDKHDDYKEELNLFLRDHGWVSTCATPGAYWMWEKQLPDGRVMLTNAEHALSIEANLPDGPPSTVYADIIDERRRQDHQWGGPRHDDQQAGSDWVCYISKQLAYAESCISAEDFNRLRERFVKIAALAVAAVQSLHRREGV